MDLRKLMAYVHVDNGDLCSKKLVSVYEDYPDNSVYTCVCGCFAKMKKKGMQEQLFFVLYGSVKCSSENRNFYERAAINILKSGVGSFHIAHCMAGFLCEDCVAQQQGGGFSYDGSDNGHLKQTGEGCECPDNENVVVLRENRVNRVAFRVWPVGCQYWEVEKENIFLPREWNSAPLYHLSAGNIFTSFDIIETKKFRKPLMDIGGFGNSNCVKCTITRNPSTCKLCVFCLQPILKAQHVTAFNRHFKQVGEEEDCEHRVMHPRCFRFFKTLN